MGLGFMDGGDCECNFVEYFVGFESLDWLVEREKQKMEDEEIGLGSRWCIGLDSVTMGICGVM